MIFNKKERELLDRARAVLHAKMVRSNCFKSADSVKLYLQTKLAGVKNECFGLLLLDSQHQLIEDKIIHEGTVNSCAVYPRIVVEHTIRVGAAAIIVYHPHPSFQSEPSPADRQITDKIQAALKLIDVSLLDHFIVGHTVFSFAEKGLL